MTIEIQLNGEAHSVAVGQSLHDLIESLQLTGALAVAVNRQVVTRQLWLQRELQPNDRVEIVRAIGGG